MSPLTAASDYQSVLSFLFGRINYERIAMPSSPAAFKLQIMRGLLDRLGNPQLGLNVVHVAGTKGKGSTASMISSILVESGYSTGLYTSPHLDRVEERVCIDGTPCTAAQFAERMHEMIPVIEQMDRDAEAGRLERGPTFFEITTALSLVHFARRPVDFAVLEVGLGGRLDSTNVCNPLVSVITSISYDHTKVLGETLAAIAAEKAGIIKPRVPVVCGVTEAEPLSVIQRIADNLDCPTFLFGRDFWSEFPLNGNTQKIQPGVPAPFSQPTFSYVERVEPGDGEKRYDDLKLNLLGRHQAANAALAVAVSQQLKSGGWPIAEDAVRRGLAKVHIPARIEIWSYSPLLIVDAAHNVASVRALVATLGENVQYRKAILIFATSRDKDCAGMLRELLARFDHVILTRFVDNPRARSLERLEQITRSVAVELENRDGFAPRVIQVCESPDSSLQAARAVATDDDLICICGSSFIAGETRRALQMREVADCRQPDTAVSAR